MNRDAQHHYKPASCSRRGTRSYILTYSRLESRDHLRIEFAAEGDNSVAFNHQREIIAFYWRHTYDKQTKKEGLDNRDLNRLRWHASNYYKSENSPRLHPHPVVSQASISWTLACGASFFFFFALVALINKRLATASGQLLTDCTCDKCGVRRWAPMRTKLGPLASWPCYTPRSSELVFQPRVKREYRDFVTGVGIYLAMAAVSSVSWIWDSLCIFQFKRPILP